ncbi:DnaD domain-containing protein [Vagococcus sp. JNUCC 83]
MVSLDTFLKSGTTNVSNLLLSYYKHVGMTDSELLFYFQLLSYQEKGDYFPDMQKITQPMSLSIDSGYQMVQELMTKGIISIETKPNIAGKTEDRYDLMPVYEKIEQVMRQENEKKISEIIDDKKASLFNQFEQEFGRSLSPIELETIQQWLDIDKYSVELIELALREAILNQAYSLKYMDRILLNWERKNLTSKQLVQQDQKKRLQEIDAKKPTSQESDLPEIPMYNWLNPGDK